MAKGQVCSKQNTHEIIQNETLSFKKIIVSGLGGRAECHLQCTANIRVVAAIRNLPGRLPREPSSRPLISSAMDGRGVHISDDKEQNLLARSVRSALSREQPECVRGASPPANLRHARQSMAERLESRAKHPFFRRVIAEYIGDLELKRISSGRQTHARVADPIVLASTSDSARGARAAGTW